MEINLCIFYISPSGVVEDSALVTDGETNIIGSA